MGKRQQIDLSYDEIKFLIGQFVLSMRDRELISDRLLDGASFAELSEKYFLCERQVKNIVRKCKETIFSHVNRLPK